MEGSQRNVRSEPAGSGWARGTPSPEELLDELRTSARRLARYLTVYQDRYGDELDGTSRRSLGDARRGAARIRAALEQTEVPT